MSPAFRILFLILCHPSAVLHPALFHYITCIHINESGQGYISLCENNTNDLFIPVCSGHGPTVVKDCNIKFVTTYFISQPSLGSVYCEDLLFLINKDSMRTRI